MFTFNPLLNSEYLQEIYGDDLSIVQIMFESFIDDNIPIWEGIPSKIQSGNFKEVSDMTHQIKPSFTMVGLGFLHPKVHDLELYAKGNPDVNTLVAKYDTLAVEINHAKLIIKDELKRLNAL
jgi:hypothetical protein